MERIPFLPRLGAFLIDLGIFTAAVHLFAIVDVLLNTLTSLNNFGFVSLFGGSILLIGYGLLEVLLAGTPGKRVCGLIIATEEGRPATAKPLLKRWAVKQCPVFFAAPMAACWTILSPHNYHFPLPDFVAVGVRILAIIDTVLTGSLLLMIFGGCFLALQSGRQTLHDRIAGTAVYPRSQVLATAAFRPVIAIAQSEATPENSAPAPSGVPCPDELKQS